MKIQDLEPHILIKILNSYSSIASVELPALGVAIMTLIPGLLDEAFVGFAALIVVGILKLVRYYIIEHREVLLELLEQYSKENKISQKEYNEVSRTVNKLTLAGGK